MSELIQLDTRTGLMMIDLDEFQDNLWNQDLKELDKLIDELGQVHPEFKSKSRDEIINEFIMFGDDMLENISNFILEDLKRTLNEKIEAKQ